MHSEHTILRAIWFGIAAGGWIVALLAAFAGVPFRTGVWGVLVWGVALLGYVLVYG